MTCVINLIRMINKTDSKRLSLCMAFIFGQLSGKACNRLMLELCCGGLKRTHMLSLCSRQKSLYYKFHNCRFKRYRLTAVLPTLLWVFISFYTSACTTTNNYAPVRPYQRDLVNSDKYYVVKKGDTLYSIGFRSGHGYQRLSEWNRISPPYKLQVGQKIKLFKSKQKLRTTIRKKNKKTVLTKKRTPSQKKRIPSQKTSTISNDNKKMLKFYWQWPLKGRILKYFSSTGSKGIDIYGKIGQKVRSASSGKVVYSGSGLKGYGNLLIIKHNYLYLSAYANNRRLLVKEGQIVKKGQVIAEVGQVGGKKTSLHFEIRKNGKPVNPLNYLPKK